MNRQFFAGTVVCLLSILASLSARADNSSLMQLIEILYKKGTLSREEYQMLQNASDSPRRDVPDTDSAKIPPKKTDNSETGGKTATFPSKKTESPPTVDVTTTGGLKVKSREGDFEFGVGGRLQIDSGFHHDDVTDNANGTELRRARLDLSGKVNHDWKFKVSFDFADNAVEAKSAYVAYDGFNPVILKAGLLTAPFSLSEATSSLFGTFMEEPMLVNAFKPDDRIGVGVESSGDFWSAQMALFGEGSAPNEVDDEANGLSARMTVAPILEKSSLLHLGGSVIYQNPDSVAEGNADLNGNGTKGENVKTVRFRSRPETHVGVGRFVDTKAIYSVDSWTSYGLELAGVKGPFSLESEYVTTQVARTADQPDLRFYGYYVGGSWFITNESRPYQVKTGEFGRVRPRENFNMQKGGWGAWQVAARTSLLDLTDKNINGGKEVNTTLGINWYLNPQLRLTANYVLVDAQKSGKHDEPRLFETRLQVDF